LRASSNATESIVPFEGSKSLKKMAFLGETQEKILVKQRRKNIDCWMDVLMQDMLVEYNYLKKGEIVLMNDIKKMIKFGVILTASPLSLT
jgi:hypothetical protein